VYLSRRQGKEEGISIGPVTAPEVKQPLLLQAVVQALSYACQHVQCKSTPPLLAQEHEGQPYESLPGSMSAFWQIWSDKPQHVQTEQVCSCLCTALGDGTSARGTIVRHMQVLQKWLQLTSCVCMMSKAIAACTLDLLALWSTLHTCMLLHGRKQYDPGG